jgi:hypothetical protein
MRAGMLIATLLLTAPAVAAADPVVAPGGKPGVATAWKAAGKNVELTIKDGFAAKDVAAAIVKGVSGAKAEIADGKVTVSGVPIKKLVAALQKVQVEPALDDIGAAFAAIQGAEVGEESTGSSIRATSETTLPGETATRELTGKVTEVRYGKFPHVALTIQTSEGALAVIPRILTDKTGAIASDDASSRQNVSAWYARAGDQVKITVGDKAKRYWVATRYERVR